MDLAADVGSLARQKVIYEYPVLMRAAYHHFRSVFCRTPGVPSAFDERRAVNDM